jgi:hypothetical protein
LQKSSSPWGKMRLGVDADSQEIVTMELTPDDVRDVSTVPDLLAQTRDKHLVTIEKHRRIGW